MLRHPPFIRSNVRTVWASRRLSRRLSLSLSSIHPLTHPSYASCRRLYAVYDPRKWSLIPQKIQSRNSIYTVHFPFAILRIYLHFFG
jgi:hypothetical protein